MKKYLTSTGRLSRSEFWLYFGSLYLVFFLIGFADEALSISESVRSIVGLMLFPFVLIGIIVKIKRWHDRNKSGWWVLINFLPVIGCLWALVELGFVKGTEGDNRFGSDPLSK